MSLFDVKRIKWYKYMENTIENVKVSNIAFESDNTVRFEFLNAEDNQFRGTLVCSGILKFNMEYGGESAVLPYLVWDVRVKDLSEDEIKDA
ncbi:MAG: hypothetical protein IJR59_02210, partial [Firmicutes bacterium]|nr:hypothetical protein [Bacillota bacterium]